MSPPVAAKAFAGLLGGVIAFQLALALGAPWGEVAMGGAFPGAYPPAMRVAAVVQAGVLAAVGVVILSRAGVVRYGRRFARVLAWVVVGLLAVGVVLNLITPSALERMIWAPVTIVLFALALRVAAAR